MNIIKKTAIFAHLALISITVTAQDKLIIKGSDTLGAKMIPKIAEAYENKNPGTKFEIAAEGSSTGIAAIIDGTAHIGMSSRELKEGKGFRRSKWSTLGKNRNSQRRSRDHC